MSEKTYPKFVQIIATSDSYGTSDLFALDEVGGVWLFREDKQVWEQVSDDRK